MDMSQKNTFAQFGTTNSNQVFMIVNIWNMCLILFISHIWKYAMKSWSPFICMQSLELSYLCHIWTCAAFGNMNDVSCAAFGNVNWVTLVAFGNMNLVTCAAFGNMNWVSFVSFGNMNWVSCVASENMNYFLCFVFGNMNRLLQVLCTIH